MSPDGSRIVFAWNKTGERMRDLYLMDYPSGKINLIAAASKIDRLLNQDDARTDEQKKDQEKYDGGFGGGAVWSPDSKEFLLGYRGRTWIFNREGKQIKPLFDGSFDASNIQYSPDGKYLCFLSNSNVWRMDRQTGALKQLTFVTRGETAVGNYAISPDSKTVAINWSAFGDYGSHIMMDFTRERSVVRPISRMWNGNVESMNERYGFVSIDGGLIKFIDSIPRQIWGLGSRGAGWSWAPDSSGFLVGWKSEDHKEWTLSYISRSSGKEFPILHEVAPKNYINNWRPFEWTRDSSSVLVGTDIWEGKFTNRYILKIDKSGKNPTPYFKKDYDVASLQRPKDSDSIIMATQSRDGLMGEITVLDNKGVAKQYMPIEFGWNTPTEFEESGDVLASDDGRSIVTLANEYKTNPELYGILPEVKRMTVSQLPEFSKITWVKPRIVHIPGPEGATIHASMYLPPDYQPGKRYPVILHNMYANSGKLSWGGYQANYMAKLGIIVMCVDFRASWGYGGEFNSGYYQRMGLIDSEEAVAVKRYLVKEGFADEKRVGVWGWSYGGFLTCMILMTQPGEFKTGVAVASPTEWKNYNHWYTRQRLGLASKDKAVFDKTSPYTYADKLQDDLLLVHGMLDDNVLFQDSVRLSMKLIDLGKNFEMFYYPRDDHSIGLDETRKHVQRLIVQHIYDQLGD